MAAKDLGPLDWRVPIVNATGLPSPEFQRRWNTQRNNNGLIGFVLIGSGAPTDPPTGDGEVYIDIAATPPVIYTSTGGDWVAVGVIAFTQLSDVPHDYTGGAGKLLRVNVGESGLEFDALSAVLDTLGATEGDVLYRGAAGWAVLAPGTAGDVLSTGGPAADPSWVPQSGGGGGGMTLIATSTPAGAASLTFSAIPGTFHNLEVVGMFGNVGGSANSLSIQFNGDTGNNYYGQRMFSSGNSGANGVQQGTATSGILSDSPQASSSPFPEIIRATIPLYTNTAFNKAVKTISSFPGGSPTSSQFDTMSSVWWNNTAAITAITLLSGSGNFATGSEFLLYGW